MTNRQPDAASPPISVVMSVYNGSAFVGEAIDSICAQTFEDFEFLIVDDGSDDGTAEILDSHARRDTRIRVISQENQGLIRSLNHGISEARGRYIARMDADDIALPDRLAKQFAYMEGRPAVGVVGGSVQQIDRDGGKLGAVPAITDPTAIRRRLLDNSPIAHPTAMIRCDVLAGAGGYRPAFRHAEDYDLWTRISERAELANLPDVVLLYRVHGGNVSRKYLAGKLQSVLLARASARARARCGIDPADRLDAFPDDFVERFLQAGETREWLESEAGPVMLARMATAGDMPAARRWAKAVLAGNHRGQARRMVIEQLVETGRRRFRSGEFRNGLTLLSWAFQLRPSRALKRLLAATQHG